MTSVKEEPPEHILDLLGHALRALRDDLLVELAGRRLPRSARGLRGSQLRLLALAPPEGIRVTDLAVRLGMTKQALGEFANALEAKGLLESVGDARDKRVRLLRPTRAGRAAARAWCGHRRHRAALADRDRRPGVGPAAVDAGRMHTTAAARDRPGRRDIDHPLDFVSL